MIGALRERTYLQSVINENVKETEAAIGGSVKKVFLKILQNSQENTCARVDFLIKLQSSDLLHY